MSEVSKFIFPYVAIESESESLTCVVPAAEVLALDDAVLGAVRRRRPERIVGARGRLLRIRRSLRVAHLCHLGFIVALRLGLRRKGAWCGDVSRNLKKCIQ